MSYRSFVLSSRQHATPDHTGDVPSRDANRSTSTILKRPCPAGPGGRARDQQPGLRGNCRSAGPLTSRPEAPPARAAAPSGGQDGIWLDDRTRVPRPPGPAVRYRDAPWHHRARRRPKGQPAAGCAHRRRIRVRLCLIQRPGCLEGGIPVSLDRLQVAAALPRAVLADRKSWQAPAAGGALPGRLIGHQGSTFHGWPAQAFTASLSCLFACAMSCFSR